MNEKEKKTYLEQYKKDKEKGVPFYPDILFKDAVVSLLIFLVLAALAYFIGAPLEERANPSDTSYTPKPEWYFLFLFQLLKYFPGELEVVAVVVIPTLAIILLFLLPFLDRSTKRHFWNRPLISVLVIGSAAGVLFLTVQSIRETPPPAEASQGDPVAALYTENCAVCHSGTITVPEGTNLHDVIAQGTHEGMPAWSGDMTTDEIDALAGFILSPGGNALFKEYCSECHETSELVASDPIELKAALDEGDAYAPHAEVSIPEWSEEITLGERTALLNFLVAPDGQRLFATNCAQCHGRSVGFAGEENELRDLVSQGGLHLEMPPWRDTLNSDQLDALAQYVTASSDSGNTRELFEQYCASCHGKRIPTMDDYDQAREIIASGGAHETMPVWGEVLTSEQLGALVSYTMEAAEGTSLEAGQELFAQNCAVCHGDFGEGGPNPARSDDVIAPISTTEYLTTRDDHTLFQVIAQGQPNFGMSPFGSTFGGPLDDDQINTMVAYIRSWEANPPVELPPEVDSSSVSLSSGEVYAQLCAQCHGPEGLGDVGPSLRDPEFRAGNTSQDIFETISKGHEATPMIRWGDLLSQDTIQELTDFILGLEISEAGVKPEPTPGFSSFAEDVLPIFEAKCAPCHGSMGGWDSSSYDTVMTSGDNAPTIIPNDVENSILAQKITDTQTYGTMMPPGGKMTNNEIQLILDWISAGAPDN
ncbi:MAG: Cbb3-type cytochrome c oxidase subunit FixP [Chloroflexi bacterium]|nr:Cbb3-type cytochrome c oxidase subunit FixP [Chloroflexota bacterium]